MRDIMLWRLWLGACWMPHVLVLACAVYPHRSQLQLVFWLQWGWLPCFVPDIRRMT